jgi:hypothetical protein
MKNYRKLIRTILAIGLLFAVALAVPWRALAAQLAQVAAGPRVPARIVASAQAEPVPGGPAFQMVNALQFRPATPDLLVHYFNDELVNPGQVGNFYQAALTIPNKIAITKMVVYFYDNSQADFVVALWRFDPSTGDHLEMATVASSDAQAQYRNVEDVTILEPLIDQQRYSYYIEVGMPSAGSSLRVAAVRLDYGFPTSLPIVMQKP